jgi:ATP-binding cassette subfamily B protein
MRPSVENRRSHERRGESSALHALVAIARRAGIETSYAEIRRNYALDDGEPRTRVLIAIARDLGMEGKIMRVKFKDLPRINKSLPAIIRVVGGASLVLESARIDPKAGPIAILRDPTTQDDVLTTVDEGKLASIWQGELILLKRRFKATDEQQPFGLSWLFGQVLRERALFIDIAVAAVISTIFAIAPAFAFRIIANRVLGNHSFSTLYVVIGGLLILILFETILSYFQRKLTEVATTRIDGRLNLILMERLLKLPISYFERNPTGRIMSKIGRLGHLRNFLTGSLFNTFVEAVPLLFIIPILFILDWRVATFVLVMALIVSVILLAFLKPLGRRYSDVIQAENRRGAHLVESIFGMRTIKTLAIEGRRRREWDARVADTMAARYALGITANYPATLALPFERLIFSGSICLAAYLALASPDTASAGSIGAFVLLARRVGGPLIQIARLQIEFAEARGAIAQVADIMNAPAEDSREHSGMKPAIRGEFVFKDLSFRYSPDAPYALDRLSFTIPRGKMLGVMGRSGSGKTTLTKLLQRLHSNYEGLIKIDGIDIREVDLAHLRTHLGVVLQENFLFSGTVRENISIARPNATMEEVVRAAQLAGAEEFIERLPRGYDTVLEEGGSNLSGGQRQRLAIARALLPNPPVLILDEATSSLDAESEAIINANLRRIAHGRTVITISHRLSMLVEADAILVLERGREYDMGTHEELLDRCDIYKQLWHQQNRHIDRGRKPSPPLAIGRS